MRSLKTILFITVFVLIAGFSFAQEFEVEVQKTGPWNTNCYLIYDTDSREAAIVDAGVSVDSLTACIKKKNLKLKYIFLTHGHQDHIAGVPGLLKQFPEAKLCISKEEYKDMKAYSKWREIFTPGMVNEWVKHKAIVDLMNFDYKQIAEPDIFTEEDREYKLGELTVKALKNPGHSRGSVCYYVKNAVFCGDLITYSAAGYLDYRFGSVEGLTKSIRRLYKLFPDETVIYSGHGKASTIGYEKKSNRNVTADKLNW